MKIRQQIPAILLLFTTWLNSAWSVTTDHPLVSPFDSDYELKRTPEQIDKALRKHKIIPDLLDKAPMETIYVEWIDGPCAKLGNEIKEIHELECRPLWVNYKNFLRQQHTMIMLGLDEPSAKNRSSSLFLYWLVTNIPPHSFDNVPATDYVMGETHVDYREPTPLKDTGLHRYVFLVYPHENRTLSLSIPKLEHGNVTERHNFNLKEFVKHYNLEEPYAINYFVAQYQRPPYMDATDAPSTAEP